MLENNSNNMKTVVETFLVEETVDLIYDNEKLDKWNKQVEELGLTGQTKIVKKDKSPIPFLHMKTSLVNVFKTLCPTAVDIKEYNISPIPVEILDLVSLSIKEEYFSRIHIWYDDKNPDPVCVGELSTYYTYNDRYQTIERNLTYDQASEKKKNGECYNYVTENTQFYLIGKWGDVKHSFEELKQNASDRYKKTVLNEYQQEIKNYQRKIEDLDNEAFNKFN